MASIVRPRTIYSEWDSDEEDDPYDLLPAHNPRNKNKDHANKQTVPDIIVNKKKIIRKETKKTAVSVKETVVDMPENVLAAKKAITKKPLPKKTTTVPRVQHKKHEKLPAPVFTNGEGSFLCTYETLQQTLRTYGVAVIPGVITSDQCSAMQDDICESLNKVTELFTNPFDETSEICRASISKVPSVDGFYRSGYGMGASDVVFSIRTDQNVIDGYQIAYSETDLRMSFEGVYAHFPVEYKREDRGPVKRVDGMCMSQHPIRQGHHYYRSIVMGTDVKEGGAAFCCYLKSHEMYADFAETFSDVIHHYRARANYAMTNEQAFYFTDNGCEHVAIMCSAGSQIFYDSRLVVKLKSFETSTEPFLAVPVSMCPAADSLYDWVNDKRHFEGFPHANRIDLKRFNAFLSASCTCSDPSMIKTIDDPESEPGYPLSHAHGPHPSRDVYNFPDNVKSLLGFWFMKSDN